MPTLDGASLNALLSMPLVLPASIAGALAALLVVLLIMMFRRGGARRLGLRAAAVALAGFAVAAVLDRMAQAERGAERRALAQRNAELTTQVLAPGSTLACLDGAAGETVENACEKTIFGAPQSTASAISYMTARLTLLSDGLAFARHGDSGFSETLAGMRRAIELDRFGIVAHVLAVRDGCNAEKCAVFALLNDTGTLKANLKAQIFNQYVSRYAADWNKIEPVAEKQTPPAPVANSSAPPGKTPIANQYDFPSAASIPPVSIMNAEPPPPKDPAGHAGAPPPAPDSATPTAKLPVPPKRPQNQAPAPPAR